MFLDVVNRDLMAALRQALRPHARLAASHQITSNRQQSIGPIMANIQYFAKPPSRNAGTNRVIIIKATRITAGQTRRGREPDGLTGELDPAGAASVSLLMT